MDWLQALFGLSAAKQQQEAIEALRTSHSIQGEIRDVLMASEKQTLEVINLTRVMAVLTVLMFLVAIVQVVIGGIQIWLMAQGAG